MSAPAEDEIDSASREVSRHTNFMVVWIVCVLLSILIAALSLPRGIATLSMVSGSAWGVLLVAVGVSGTLLAAFCGYKVGKALSQRNEARRKLDRAVAIAADLAD